MSIIKDKSIAIVGGGPGGLTLARLLQMNGADVTVYERDAHKDARPKGATLDLHEESGLAALRAAGLMAAFEANYRPGADRIRIMDKNAAILLDEHTNVEEEREWNRPEIDRGPLQQILLDSLRPGTVVWNKQFTELNTQNGVWQLSFKCGIEAYADIVIAADGANSKLRPYLTPIKPFYAGVTAVEGAVHNAAKECPMMNELLKGGKIFAFGDEQSLIVGAKGDGSLVFYMSWNTDENWSRDCGIDFTDKTQVITWFRQQFAGWDDAWLELFENAYGAFIVRPQYCMPFDQSWDALPNLTMLGDAAHLMPPFAGEGVNMAMLDALELAQTLTDDSYTDAQQAIAAYEKQMRARAGETAKDTMESTRLLHSTKAISFMMNMGQEG